VRSAVLEVRATASLHAFPRVGFVVPKYRQSAVSRNRLKRRLRELVRLEWLEHLTPMDVVIRVAPAAYQRDFVALQRDMRDLMERLRRMPIASPQATPVSDTSAPPAE
jgi:ribonuclease P protein component